MYCIGDGTFLCIRCRLRKSPPVLVLQQCSEFLLLNKSTNRYERDGAIKEMLECGWFIRRKIVSFENDIIGAHNRITHYYLEYYGEVVCNRCKDVLFPQDFPACTKICGGL